MPIAETLGLFYTDEGSGPPVVLAHGFGLTHELWREQLVLSDEFRLIAYDSRGCGASMAPTAGYDYPDLSGDLVGLLDHLGLERAHMVGHALGGGVMLHTALERPERVASLCLFDSALVGFPWSDGFLGVWARCAEIAPERGVLAALQEAWLQGDMFSWVRERRPEVFAEVAAMTARWAGREWLGPFPFAEPAVSDLERLNEVRVPLFVLSGQEDLHDFVEIANMLSWWVSGALQRSLLGVGHFPMLENPNETNLYLRGWLRKMAGAGLNGAPDHEGHDETMGTGANDTDSGEGLHEAGGVAATVVGTVDSVNEERPGASLEDPDDSDQVRDEGEGEDGAGEEGEESVDRSFTQFGLSERVLQAIDKMGFVEATPIQLKALPLVLAGKDILGQAQTGTGKTAAFGIPIAERFPSDAPVVQALVLCPTRELAMQVAEEVHELCLFTGHKVLPVYGGQRIDRQLTALRKGVQVVVGTPGRILDHLGRGTLKLSEVRMLVLDEADMMLDMGFLPDIRRIIRQCPQGRQTLLFSATIPDEIRRISSEYMHDPVSVSVVPEILTLEDTEQIFYEIPEDDKLDALMRLLDAEKEDSSVMIFCRTRRNVDKLTRKLKAQGYDVDGLHGDLTQQQRDRIMQDFRDRKFPYLIATDVASRGLDISHVTHVINYHIPQDPEAYVHRIGRTGRMGRSGVAITFVTPAEYWDLLRIQEFSMAQIEPGELPPPVAEVRERGRRGERPSRAVAEAVGVVSAGEPAADLEMAAAGLGVAAEAEAAAESEVAAEPTEVPVEITAEVTVETLEEATPPRRPRRRRAPAPPTEEESIIELTPAGREAIIELTPRGLEALAGLPADEAIAQPGAPEGAVAAEETTEAERRQRRYAERDARRRIERAPADEVGRESSRIEREQLVDAAQREAWAASAEGQATAESERVAHEAAGQKRDQLERERRAEVEERLRVARAGGPGTAFAVGLGETTLEPLGAPAAEILPGTPTTPVLGGPPSLEPLLEPEEEARIQWGLGLFRRVQALLDGLDPRQARDYRAVADRLLVDHEARSLAAGLLHELALREGVQPVRKEPAEMARLFVSIGRRSRVSKEELQRLVRETAGIAEEDIGRIDLLHNFAFIEVRKAVAAEVIDKMHESMFKGREISVAPAKPAGKGAGATDE